MAARAFPMVLLLATSGALPLLPACGGKIALDADPGPSPNDPPAPGDPPGDPPDPFPPAGPPRAPGPDGGAGKPPIDAGGQEGPSRDAGGGGSAVACFVAPWNAPATSCTGKVLTQGSMRYDDTPETASHSCEEAVRDLGRGGCCMYHLYGEGRWYVTDGEPRAGGTICDFGYGSNSQCLAAGACQATAPVRLGDVTSRTSTCGQLFGGQRAAPVRSPNTPVSASSGARVGLHGGGDDVLTMEVNGATYPLEAVVPLPAGRSVVDVVATGTGVLHAWMAVLTLDGEPLVELVQPRLPPEVCADEIYRYRIVIDVR